MAPRCLARAVTWSRIAWFAARLSAWNLGIRARTPPSPKAWPGGDGEESLAQWAERYEPNTQLRQRRQYGYLELVYEAMDLPANPDWFMFACTAEPGSPAEERLTLLGSLAASPEALRRHAIAGH